MSVEKFFKEWDPLIKEIWWSLAYGKSLEDPEVAQKLQQVLSRKEIDSGELDRPIFHDMSSTTYPNEANTTLEDILSNKEKYIPYLAAQLKDLFVAEYSAAAEKEKGYI